MPVTSKMVIPNSNYSIRLAQKEDVNDILAMAKPYFFEPLDEGSKGFLLPFSREQAEYRAANGWTAVVELDNGYIIGTASLIPKNGIAEICSLVIDPRYQKVGIGSELLDYWLERAHEIAPDSNYVKSLTRLRDTGEDHNLFLRHGFAVSEIWDEKLQSDCARCPINERCPETPVVYKLN